MTAGPEAFLCSTADFVLSRTTDQENSRNPIRAPPKRKEHAVHGERSVSQPGHPFCKAKLTPLTPCNHTVPQYFATGPGLTKGSTPNSGCKPSQHPLLDHSKHSHSKVSGSVASLRLALLVLTSLIMMALEFTKKIRSYTASISNRRNDQSTATKLKLSH
jgi:hypothetical protein